VSVITDTWRQLVRRRLWPVALLLLAALVAVPVVLAKEPERLDAPVAPAAPAAADSPGEPVVALASTADRAERRRVLGSRKDPFAPAPRRRARATSTDEPAGTPDIVTTETAPEGPASGGGSAPSAPLPSFTPTPVAPVPTATPEPPKTHELYSLTVRFGDSTSDELARMDLPRLRALPSQEDPVLVYLGVSEDGKRAVFLPGDGLEMQGDGECKPDPETCETLELAEGETQFIDVLGEDGEAARQYQLDIVRIHKTKTNDAAKAAAAKARVSAAGRRVLAARIAVDGPLRVAFDAETGTVRRLSKKAFRAAVSRAKARAARAGGPRPVARKRP
jgi:hypothetical protein